MNARYATSAAWERGTTHREAGSGREGVKEPRTEPTVNGRNSKRGLQRGRMVPWPIVNCRRPQGERLAKANVRFQWDSINFLRDHTAAARGWLVNVLNASRTSASPASPWMMSTPTKPGSKRSIQATTMSGPRSGNNSRFCATAGSSSLSGGDGIESSDHLGRPASGGTATFPSLDMTIAFCNNPTPCPPPLSPRRPLPTSR